MTDSHHGTPLGTARAPRASSPRGAPAPGLHYLDLAAALLAVLAIAGRLAVHGRAASSPLASDAAFWMAMLGAVLIPMLRRSAYTHPSPWIAAAPAGAALAGVAALFWRVSVIGFLGATLAGAALLLAGLVLRGRRLRDRLVRQDVFALIAAGLGLAMTVALTEICLRLGSGLFNVEARQLLRSADPRNFGVPHPYLGHLHTPDNAFELAGRDFRAVHHVDGVGFRNAWPWPDQADIVTVGDSVTFGLCVQDDEGWPSLVRRGLAPRPLVNLGLIGAGPQQYLRLFETFGVGLRPKVLLVGVFARNDFGDADVFDRWVRSGVGGNYWAWRIGGQPPPLRFSLTEPVDTLRRVWNGAVFPPIRRTHLYILLSALRDGAEGAPPRVFAYPDGRRLLLLEHDYLRKISQNEPGLREFGLMLDSLERIHALAARHGTHALTVFLPGKEETYLPLLGEPAPDPTAALRAALDARGIEYLNLNPAFRARAAAGEQLFFEADGHPNAAGHAAIAEAVLEHLTTHAARYGLAGGAGSASGSPNRRARISATRAWPAGDR